MLECVDVVLRPNRDVAVLERSTGLISRFLGPLSTLSLSDACATGSVKLLDWIWTSSCAEVANRSSCWTLSNYLRSDPHYYRWQFTKSLEVAASRGDLAVVEWILAHFTGYEATELVVEVAAAHGRLNILQLLWARDAGTENQHNADKWPYFLGLTAAKNGHSDVVRWLYKIKPISVEIYNVIQEALWHGDFDLAQELLPQGECLVDYAEGCPLPEVIEWMVSSGRLRCEFSLAARAIRDLARTGHLERMQQIAQLHSPLPEHHDPLRGYWADAIRYACEYGDLKIVQWLMEHPLGLEACEGLAESQRTGGGFTMDDLLEAAAGRGHIEILQYLCDQPVLYFYNRAVEAAVRGGHLECVECLLIQLSHGGQKANPPVIDIAARYGRVDIVKHFHGLDSLEGCDHPLWKRGSGEAWWSQSERATYNAAAYGDLELVQWLCKNCREKDSLDLAYGAACGGHLDIVRWLNDNHIGEFTEKVMDGAAAGGHLDVVKWLHTNRNDGCTTSAMNLAAEHGHFEMIKWLHAHRAEGCTVRAVNQAVAHGDLRIASFLRVFVPQHVPSVWLSEWMPHLFEMVLFLAQYRDAFPRQFRFLEWILQNDRSYSTNEPIIKAWLEANYPEWVAEIRVAAH